MYRIFLFVIVFILFVSSACAMHEPTPEEQGLKTRAELNAYFVVPKDPNINNTYISHFAKANLMEGNSVVIGAVSSINYDLPNSQRGSIEIFHVLWGSKLKKTVNVYSSEIGFLEACTGEQIFVLKTFAGGNNAKILTNFQLDTQIREYQIKTLNEILKLEQIDNFLLRRKEFVEQCLSHMTDEVVWVANAWSFQFFHFCKNYAEYIDFKQLAKLKQLEAEYVRNRPYASEVLKVIKATIIVLLKRKFKRVWFNDILNGTKEEAKKAIQLLDFWFSSSYSSAFSFEDRVVINSIMNLIDDPLILDQLFKLEQNLKDVLSNYGF